MNLTDALSFSNGWKDLEKYGIKSLTGEACAYSMRLLCDLNEDGAKVLASFFGATLSFTEGSNWNSMVNDKPARYSVLLPRGILDELRQFIIFSVCGKTYCYRTKHANGVMIGSNEDHPLEGLSSGRVYRVVNFEKTTKQPSIGGRNIHAMSGRVV
mgnify:CR=1 FL=1